ncbi:MAG: hypothetical protein HRT88_21695, partial [Lentisphaeraceae bacterium]|nr:hypothetical protein [Lentisphaeraceae bacterium]
MNELKIALNMFLAPKKGFLALPKHKPCVLATLFVLLLMLERGLRSWDIYKQQISLWSFLGIVLMTFAVLWPLSGLFTMGLCRIFGKRISFWLAINICGFAHTPRVFSSSIIWFLPYSDISLFSKITIALFAMAILVYSTGLWIYGLV